MKLDELDEQMRVYETAHDYCVLPGLYIVARLDGRSFTALTRERSFDKPFDAGFRDLMVGATEHLMTAGFKVLYGYTQSDEISLLFHRDDATFKRKVRKINSVLAGEASAWFSLRAATVACFDCRVSQLPTAESVIDYFRWRQSDARRNALHGHCYWTLRREGNSARGATSLLDGASVADKIELLSQRGIDFSAVPTWNRRGAGVYWETYEKAAVNPMTGEDVMASRRRLKIDLALSSGDDYGTFVQAFVVGHSP